MNESNAEAFQPSTGPEASPLVTPAPESVKRRLPEGLLFGSAAGLLAGAMFGGISCCLIGLADHLGTGVLVGMLAGLPGGMVLGTLERRLRGRLARPDTATYVCVAYGCVAAFLVVPGAGLVTGRLSGMLFLGALFAGPALGLLIGAMLDRAYEAGFKKNRGEALGYGVAGVVVAAGILYGLALATWPADPEEVARAVRDVIVWQWSNKPELRGARVQEVSFTYKGDGVYEGFANATIDGESVRLRLKVVYDDRVRELIMAEAPE